MTIGFRGYIKIEDNDWVDFNKDFVIPELPEDTNIFQVFENMVPADVRYIITYDIIKE